MCRGLRVIYSGHPNHRCNQLYGVVIAVYRNTCDVLLDCGKVRTIDVDYLRPVNLGRAA